MPVIDAVVLAAGRSGRTRPVHKLLADLGGKPLLAWVLDALAPVAREIVVVASEDAVEALVGGRARVVRNPEPEAGMGVSLRLGIDALRGDADGVLQALGDVPFVGGDLAAIVAAGGVDSVVVPVHGGVRGHPVLWGAGCLEALRGLAGASARELIDSGRLDVVEVPASEAVLFDVDTPEELEEARRRVAGRS